MSKNVPLEEIQRQKDIMNYVRSLNEGKGKMAFVETYGCQQNVSDSETIMGMLEAMGYAITSCKEDADLIIYNTCAVRENAAQKVYGNLGALKHLKARRPEVILGLCGCLAQADGTMETIKKKYRHIDMVFGTHALYRFPQLVSEVISEGKRVFDVKSEDGLICENLPKKREKSPCAWVSVMYGCNNFCSYCIVPYVRGRERSRDKNDILAEVREAALSGAKEVMLLGQNVNSYGNDMNEDIDFADLLTMVCKVDGIERVRFMTSHPKDISDKLIDTMAREDKICPQLHLPIQAGNNRVLKTMNRRYTQEEYLEKIEKIKQKIPNIALTTDIIVGFPGETNEEFKDTLDVLRKVRYDTIFSFIYSVRPGTPAAKMEDVITSEDKKKNFEELLRVQDEISREKNIEYLGKTVKVLAEGPSKTNKDVLSGRTEGGKTVNFDGDMSLVGSFVNVKITEAKTWSLKGEIIDE